MDLMVGADKEKHDERNRNISELLVIIFHAQSLYVCV